MATKETALEKLDNITKWIGQQEEYLNALSELGDNVQAQKRLMAETVDKLVNVYDRAKRETGLFNKHDSATIIDALVADSSLITGAISESLKAVKLEFEIG